MEDTMKVVEDKWLVFVSQYLEIIYEVLDREFQFFNCRILFLQHTVKLTKNKKTYCYRVEMVLLNSTVDLILAP
jgi:hypothetical protein